MLSFFPLDVLDEIWHLIESVSEGFLRKAKGTKSSLFLTYGKEQKWTCEDDGHITEVGNKSLL